MFKKWKNIAELCNKIAEGSTLDNCYKDLKRISYAPNIGYRCWIFSYKRTLVCLWDMGNGHYDFYSAASWLDLIIAKISNHIHADAIKTPYIMQ